MPDSPGEHPANLFVGERLRRARKMAGYSIMQAARKSGFNYKTMERIELGRSHITIPKLWLFAHLYGVRPEYFLRGMKVDEKYIDTPRNKRFDTVFREHNVKLIEDLGDIDEDLRVSIRRTITILAEDARRKAGPKKGRPKGQGRKAQFRKFLAPERGPSVRAKSDYGTKGLDDDLGGLPPEWDPVSGEPKD